MGCSSSTETLSQGNNRPPAKSIETNGAKRSDSSDVSDQIVDDVETIPDQTKLIPITENEVPANGTTPIPPVEEEVKAIEAVELEASDSLLPASEGCDTSCGPADGEESEDAKNSTEVNPHEDSALVEGEIRDAVEAEMQEEIASEGAETKEEETGHSLDAAETEIDATNNEE
ncbi:hypothetical protein FKM82_005916 [Ascaphus truei]|uniref:glutamate-rich protein 5 isoform X2 n=1 Tax=Ascaphus truei TaxID=8439 RepID=UPI003F59C6A7